MSDSDDDLLSFANPLSQRAPAPARADGASDDDESSLQRSQSTSSEPSQPSQPEAAARAVTSAPGAAAADGGWMRAGGARDDDESGPSKKKAKTAKGAKGASDALSLAKKWRVLPKQMVWVKPDQAAGGGLVSLACAHNACKLEVPRDDAAGDPDKCRARDRGKNAVWLPAWEMSDDEREDAGQLAGIKTVLRLCDDRGTIVRVRPELYTRNSIDSNRALSSTKLASADDKVRKWADEAETQRKQWDKVSATWDRMKRTAEKVMKHAVELYKQANGGKLPPATKRRGGGGGLARTSSLKSEDAASETDEDDAAAGAAPADGDDAALFGCAALPEPVDARDKEKLEAGDRIMFWLSIYKAGDPRGKKEAVVWAVDPDSAQPLTLSVEAETLTLDKQVRRTRDAIGNAIDEQMRPLRHYQLLKSELTPEERGPAEMEAKVARFADKMEEINRFADDAISNRIDVDDEDAMAQVAKRLAA